MKPDIITFKDIERYNHNPFVEKAIQEMNIVKKTQVWKSDNKAEIQMIVNGSGEVSGYSQFLKFIEVDEEKFAKVYLSQFSAFWDLPNPAIKVFGYILTKLKPSKDSFEFLVSECMMHTAYKSKKPVYDGLTSLLNNQIIAKGYHEYIYFINPLVVFNGDRVTFAKTYIKKKKANPNAPELPFN